MIVVESVEKEFLELFTKKMAAKIMGDPLDPKSDIGPQARVDLRDELHKQVQESIKKGAKCILGGTVPSGKNALYPPTILTNVKKGMPAYDEELFGPAAAVIVAKDEEQAIAIANETSYGLAASLYTTDLDTAFRLADELNKSGVRVTAAKALLKSGTAEVDVIDAVSKLDPKNELGLLEYAVLAKAQSLRDPDAAKGAFAEIEAIVAAGGAKDKAVRKQLAIIGMSLANHKLVMNDPAKAKEYAKIVRECGYEDGEERLKQFVDKLLDDAPKDAPKDGSKDTPKDGK